MNSIAPNCIHPIKLSNGKIYPHPVFLKTQTGGRT